MVFVNPPPFAKGGDYSNLTSYAINSVLDVSWGNSFSPYSNLWLLQDGDEYTCTDLNLAKTFCKKVLPSFTPTGTSYSWVVQTYDSDYGGAVPPIYYFAIRIDSESDTSGFLSHYFNILPANQIPSSTSSLSATSSTTATTSLSRATVATTATSSATLLSTSASSTSIASSIPLSNSSQGLSDTTKAAIGVSVGVGVPLIIILVIIALFLQRRRGIVNRKRYRSSISDAPELVTSVVPQKAYSEKSDHYYGVGITTQEPLSNNYYKPHGEKAFPSELPGATGDR